MKVNSAGVKNAKALIKSGKVDKTSSWSFSAADGDAFLREGGDDWAEYAKWFLAVDETAEPDTKAYFKYPFGKDGQVYRKGVIAAKSRAAQQGQDDIETAADTLLQLIDAKKDNIDVSPASQAVTVNRIDVMMVGEEWMTKPFTRTVDGFLQGRAIVTCLGVFPYLNPDGTTSMELRLPEEVFHPDSLDSLKLKPITLDHPKGMVTSADYAQVAVGSLGSNPSSNTQLRNYDGWTPSDQLTDGYNVAIDMSINRDDAINAVLEGRNAANSCGYTCQIEDKSGVWGGTRYDKIQRNIRYNHVALVPQGRAGDSAIIKLDSADIPAGYAVSVIKNISPKEDRTMLKKINLDGVDREAEDAVIVHITQQKAKLDTVVGEIETLKTDKSTLEAERDAAKLRADKAEGDLKTLRESAPDKAKIDEAVKAKIRLFDVATKAQIELKGDEADEAVRDAVIVKAFPTVKLDGRDEAYKSTMFDAAASVFDAEDVQATDALSRIGSSRGLTVDSALDKKYDVASARQRYIDSLGKAKEA